MSSEGLQALISHEGLRLDAYDDKQPNFKITSKSQVKGTLTIGYGHTKGVYVGQKITKAQAEQFLAEDLEYFEAKVQGFVKVPVTQNMADALIEFVYNLGEGNFKNSTVLKRLNQKDYLGAADAFLMWNKPASILKRREATKARFLKDFDGVNINTGDTAGDLVALAVKIGLAMIFV